MQDVVTIFFKCIILFCELYIIWYPVMHISLRFLDKLAHEKISHIVHKLCNNTIACSLDRHSVNWENYS